MNKLKAGVAAYPEPGSRRASILDAAMKVFGRYGYRKTSVDDLAEAAQISKQGLYLHFSGKEEIFLAALQKYLDDGLALVDRALAAKGPAVHEKLAAAMDAWFGRHLDTFHHGVLEVIEAGDRLSASQIEQYKLAFQKKLAKALSESAQFQASGNACTPREIASVLFVFGLSWKQPQMSRADFMKHVRLCIKACCQVRS